MARCAARRQAGRGRRRPPADLRLRPGLNAAGGFDRADAHITRTALRLDREGWERIAESLLETLRVVAQVEEDTRGREAAGEELELEDVGLVLMLFQAMPFSRARPGGPADPGCADGA